MLSLLSLLLAPATAQTCPDPVERTTEARRLYDAVEIEAARAAVEEGLAALACQTRVVTTAELLELYRTAALIALTRDDREGVVYATLRAVAADHASGRPPEGYGPELQAAYDTWAARLGQDLVTVRVDGAGTVWVDGRAADAMSPLSVVEGEHLLQVENGVEPLRTELQELSADLLVSTGVPLMAPPAPQPVLPDPVPEAPAQVPDRAGHRRRPVGLWLATAATGGLAGFLVGSGYRSELAFLRSPYAAESFRGCAIDQPCYDRARQDAIQADALRIRLAYGAGYGLTAVTGGLLFVTIVGLPAAR